MIADLVKLKYELLAIIDSISLEDEINKKANMIVSVLLHNESVAQHINLTDSINIINELHSGNQKIISSLFNKLELIDSEIEKIASNLPNNTYKFNLLIDEKSNETINNIVRMYSNWQYPGLLLNCEYDSGGLSTLAEPKNRIDSMVASDPLYIVKTDYWEILDYIKDYPSLYQSRVRKYEITDGKYSILPQEQFGFIHSWGFLNQLSIIDIATQLEQIFSLLRPGGVAMLTYNNGEKIETALKVDQGEIPYCSDRIIKKMAESIGFEVISASDISVPLEVKFWISWVELRKPGSLTTIKKHPVMGEIKHK